MIRRAFFMFALLMPLLATAQTFRPFLPGKLHWFTSGSNYSVRIDSVGLIGNDSAFWMNEIAIPPTPHCSTYFLPHFVPNQEGLFGDHFLASADGAYRFVNRLGDTATFHTAMPTGTPWTFLSDSNLTATISARNFSTVVGVPDSVLVIDLSDGQQYQLSQHYGLLSGPNLSYYLRAKPLRAATLAELPAVPDFKDYFAWQSGDVFTMRDTYNNLWSFYDRYEILTRYESPNGDSLILHTKHRIAQYWYPSPTYIGAPGITDLIFTRERHRFLEQATYELDTNSGGQGYHLMQSWSSPSNVQGHKSVVFNYYLTSGYVDTCGYEILTAWECNHPISVTYQSELGRTRDRRYLSFTISDCYYSYIDMVCYEMAGSDTLGPCPPEAEVLPVTDPYEAAQIGLWRDDATGEVGLVWQGMQRCNYTWEIYDLNGRLLQVDAVPMQPSGRRAIGLVGGAGIYLLRIAAPDGAWVQTIRVPFFGIR